MKETFYVAYDPVSSFWDHRLITPDFPPECWIYKVTARNGHEALKAGLDQHVALTSELSLAEMRVAQFIARQVNRVERKPDDVLMIDIAQNLLVGAESMAQRGFFKLAHNEEALIQLSSAGWKALVSHVQKQIRIDEEYDIPQMA